MTTLFLTNDNIGSQTGGGSVTYHELKALETGVGGARTIQPNRKYIDPFDQDADALKQTRDLGLDIRLVDVAHVYAGCFSKTVEYLREMGIKITYTSAAHDVDISKRESELLGIPFNYPHLTDPTLWKEYLRGYQLADVLIVPSLHSHDVMRKHGCTNRIEVIPHGTEIPEKVAPLPHQFRVGYLGSFGTDKGLRILFEAWKNLAYKDALLILGGRDSTSNWARYLWERFGGGNVWFRGWVDKMGDFYADISVYVQPSMTEGFGIEVLEAMANGRHTITSTGCGAYDITASTYFEAGDVHDLEVMIDNSYRNQDRLLDWGNKARATSLDYSWDKIRERYIKVWKELLLS